MTTYYKAFAADGRTLHNRDPWPLPKGKRPGKWLPAVDNIVPCERGYHVMTADQLCYFPGWSLYEAEVKGDVIAEIDKVVVGQARLLRRVDWDEKKLYLWLSDVAEMASGCGSTDAVQLLRDFLVGKIYKEKPNAAAYVVSYAVFAAAYASACSDVYYYDAYVAERKRQNDRMWQYIRNEVA